MKSNGSANHVNFKTNIFIAYFVEPKYPWVMWIYFSCPPGVNPTCFQKNSVTLYQVWYIWIHIRCNLKVGGKWIKTNIWIGRVFKGSPQCESFIGNMGLRGPHRFMSTGFHCTPGVMSNYVQRYLVALYPDTHFWIPVSYKLERNVFKLIFELKVFSVGNFNSLIVPLVMSMQFHCTPGLRMKCVCRWLRLE